MTTRCPHCREAVERTGVDCPHCEREMKRSGWLPLDPLLGELARSPDHTVIEEARNTSTVSHYAPVLACLICALVFLDGLIYLEGQSRPAMEELTATSLMWARTQPDNERLVEYFQAEASTHEYIFDALRWPMLSAVAVFVALAIMLLRRARLVRRLVEVVTTRNEHEVEYRAMEDA